MANDPTNNDRLAVRDARPEWANRVLDGLQDAVTCGSGDGERLLPAERDLLDAVALRLRHRLGEGGPDGPLGIDLLSLSNFVLERGTTALAAEQDRK